MQFNDTSTYDGLVQDLERKLFAGDYGYISGSTARLKTFTSYLNNALADVSVALLMSDGRWEFDDHNKTTQPVGRTALVSGQKQYELDNDYIVVDKVVVKDSSGNGYELKRIGVDEISGDPEEVFEGGGVPTHFDLRGPDIVLYPTPNYSYALGLVCYFRRKMGNFAYTDTTKEPGFSNAFHENVSLLAAASYAEDNTMESAEGLRKRADAKITSLKKFNMKRGRDSATVIRPRRTNSR